MDWRSAGLIIPDFFGWVFFRGMGAQNGFKQEKPMSGVVMIAVVFGTVGYFWGYLMGHKLGAETHRDEPQCLISWK